MSCMFLKSAWYQDCVNVFLGSWNLIILWSHWCMLKTTGNLQLCPAILRSCSNTWDHVAWNPVKPGANSWRWNQNWEISTNKKSRIEVLKAVPSLWLYLKHTHTRSRKHTHSCTYTHTYIYKQHTDTHTHIHKQHTDTPTCTDTHAHRQSDRHTYTYWKSQLCVQATFVWSYER